MLLSPKMLPSIMAVRLLWLLSVLPVVFAASCPRECSCSDHLQRVSCEHRHLDHIPADIPATATELYLGFNSLTGLPANAFSGLTNLKWLSLKNNHLLSIKVHPKAFAGLISLERLFLTDNQLTNVSKELFKDLGLLQRLYLTHNELSEVPDLGSCKNLIRLGLDNNNLKVARFPIGFMNLLNLQTIDVNNNVKITNFTKRDVQYLVNCNIRTLKLARCNLQTVDTDAFKVFYNLQALSLSYNSELSMTSIKNIINSLQNSKLASLDLSYSVQGKIIPHDLFANFSKVPLKTLTMSHMREANVIQNQTFTYLRKLIVLDLSFSALNLIEEGAFNEFESSLQRLNLFSNNLKDIPKALPNTLTYLDLSNNHGIDSIDNAPFSQLGSLLTLNFDNCGIRTVDNNAFLGLDNLTKLNIAHNTMPGSALGVKVLQPLDNLKFLYLQGNKMTQIITEEDLFESLDNLEELNLSGQKGGCRTLPPHVFKPLKSLTKLDLSNNNLGDCINNDDGSLFGSLTKLHELHLDRNNIYNMPSKLVNNLVNVRKLNLSLNAISSWDSGFFNRTQALRIVDLSNNSITLVNQSSVAGLPGNVTLNLVGNPFNCWCGLIWFREWMDQMKNSTKVVLQGASSFTCFSPKQMFLKKVFDFKTESIKAQCPPPPWILIICVVSGSIAGLITFSGALVYRHRWRLRLKMYYLGKRFRKGKPTRKGYDTLEGSNEEDTYDVCISYGPSDHDSKWVKQQLMVKLTENDKNVFFDEYVLPNETEIGPMDEAMLKSKKILLVISKDYLKDGRRTYEIELALSSHNKIILVVMDEKIVPLVPHKLHPFINNNQHIVWTEYQSAEQEMFWNTLEQQLNKDEPLTGPIQV